MENCSLLNDWERENDEKETVAIRFLSAKTSPSPDTRSQRFDFGEEEVDFETVVRWNPQKSGKQKEQKHQNGSSNLNSTTELNLWELDTMKFPLIVRGSTTSKSRRVKRKLHARQQQKIDKEHDIVLVPSDGSCISDSDSDASDWSVGWSEPHAPGFQSDDENDSGFGVLVQCYGPKNRDAGPVGSRIKVNATEVHSMDSNKYMEQWLSSLQRS